MQLLTHDIHTLNPLSQVPIDESLQRHLDAVRKSERSEEAIDSFYLEMLELYAPEAQKNRYIAQLEKKISAVFRINGVMQVILYLDSTVESFSKETNELLSSLNEAPLSAARISHLFYHHYGDELSVEYFCGANPTYSDLKQGYLYSREDIEAGFVADSRSLEEHMCNWLSHYQLWVQDYLYFNLAQVSTAHLPERKRTTTSLLDSAKTQELPTVLAL